MSKQEGRFYEFGPFRLLPDERLLLRDGEPVALTPKSFDTLVAFVQRAGRLADKDELLKAVWPDSFVEESNLAQNVFALRRVLGEDENGKPFIETVPKCGYRFVASVKVFEDRGEELLVRHHLRAGSAQSGGQQTVVSDHATVTLSVPESNGERDVTRMPATPVTLPLTSNAVAPQFVQRRRWNARLVIGSITLALALVGLGLVIARLFLNSPQSSQAIPLSLSRILTGTRIWSAAISPDGRHVAHVVDNSGLTSIWVRQVSTTTDLQVVSPAPDTFYWGVTFSREGDYLYYLKSQDESSATLYRVSALGGPSRKIVADVNSPITMSPEGKQIAFVRRQPGESVLMIADADGANEQRLAVRKTPIDYFSDGLRGGPSWSPDGRTIVTGLISLTGGYHGEVISVSVRDGTERPLTSRRWYQVAQVAWLPDGSGLLAAAREAAEAQIWHVSYPDGALRKITNDLNDYHGVSLTADAHTLATVQYDRPSTIAFMPEKPSSAFQRSTAGMNEGFYGMSWTPDGKLVYASEAGGNLDIWLMDQDGVTTEQLTTDSHHDSTPSVSHDGRSVVFVSYRNGDNQHVWRMDIDGRNQRQLTNQAFEGTPSFTPDGRWVVYAVSNSGIWKVSADGGQPLLIWGGDVHTPSLSPDGSLIACFYGEDKPNQRAKLALLPTAGGPPVKVFDKPEGLSSPTIRWTSDGRSLVYISTRDGVGNLWTLPLDGARPRPLTAFTSGLIFNFAWSVDDKQFALASGNVAEHLVLVRNFR